MFLTSLYTRQLLEFKQLLFHSQHYKKQSEAQHTWEHCTSQQMATHFMSGQRMTANWGHSSYFYKTLEHGINAFKGYSLARLSLETANLAAKDQHFIILNLLLLVSG